MKFRTKISLITITIVFIFMTIIITHSALAAGTWYVSPAGSDSNSCLSPESPCATINGALEKASSGDTIDVSIGTYTNHNASEVVYIGKTITLAGGWDEAFTTQVDMSIVDGEGVRIGISASEGNPVIIGRFIIQNGLNPTEYYGMGGGLWNSATTILNDSIVRGNSVSLGFGGGIGNGNSLTLNNTIVSENSCPNAGDGGGIWSYGTLIMNNSTVSGNFTSIYGRGGGIAGNGTLILNNTSVKDNIAGIYGGGGGIFNFTSITLNSSTVSGNIGGIGGGIFNYGTIFLNNSTVSGNSSQNGDGGGIYNNYWMALNNTTVSSNTSQGSGGGIYNSPSGYIGTLTLQNSIVAGNTATESGVDCFGIIGSSGYNLIGNTVDCNFTPGTGDIIDVPPLLGPLQDNRGPTLTHALLPGSPAIDAGNPNGCVGSTGLLTTDQRGIIRPQGVVCDIGAYELEEAGRQVSIDIYPKNKGNLIDITRTGNVPVAVLSTPEFDSPSRVVASSLTFGRTGEEVSLYWINGPNKPACSAGDVNGDGLKDLVCLFEIHKTGFQCGDTQGMLLGELKSSAPINGFDFVRIEPCN